MSKGKLVICFHGTDKKAADIILRDGFEKKTYFADHLENALCFGGKHVFEVVFEVSKFKQGKIDPDNTWQFTTRERVPPSKIVNYSVYNIREVKYNDRLRNKVFESNQND